MTMLQRDAMGQQVRGMPNAAIKLLVSNNVAGGTTRGVVVAHITEAS